MIEAFCAVNESPGCMSPVHANPGITALKKCTNILNEKQRGSEILGCYDFFATSPSNRSTSPAAVGFVAPLLLVPLCPYHRQKKIEKERRIEKKIN
jgi:hypothetical protein